MICMVIERLIINVFVILIPVLIYSLKAEGSWKIQRSLTMFFFMSGAVVLCMIFSVEIESVQWDLRYVPILLAFLYGGKRAGWGVVGFAVLMRGMLGGDLFITGILLIVVTAILFHFVSHRFSSMPPKWPRVWFVMVVALIPALIQTVVTVFLLQSGVTAGEEPLWSTGLEYVLFLSGASFLITHLFETLLERERIIAELVATEKDHTMGELAASIAHEVRNPLTVVKGFIQLLAEDKSQAEYHKLILSELDRAESIIYEYLNASKPQENSVISLDNCVEQVVSLLAPYAEKNGVLLDSSIKPSIQINSNENKLKQALINFVKNAIEATPDQGSVTVLLKATKDKAIIEIKDTGSGMTKEQLKQLGTAYFTTKESGTGIGTMVSIRMIEMMDGTVTYKSALTKGTKVEVVLPRVKS